jgi:hypothetical protein
MCRFSLYVFCLIIAVACNSKNPYENNLGIETSLIAQMDTANYTTIQWIDSVMDIGTIKAGDSVHLKYRFQNTGNKALFVIEARPSCGCTVTGFTKDPVMAGKTSVINATIKTGSLSGKLNKSITVVTNTKNKTSSILLIKGTVQQ